MTGRRISRKRGAESAVNYVADFETTTDPEDCRVWAWGMANVIDPDDTFEYGNDLWGFIIRLSEHPATVYFHNLAFDGSFIIDFLLKNGFTHGDSIEDAMTFKTMISHMAKFYSITVKWENGVVTEFRDSLKKLPMSVSNVAKAFKLDEQKLSIDYNEFRPVGHRLTDDEVLYLKNDVVIVARAIGLQLEEGMTRLTVGSDSLAQYQDMQGGKKMFQRLFPVLPVAVDADIRKAYRGGWTYVDPRFKQVETGPGKVYDVNSLYSSVMYDCVLPYGHPRFFMGEPKPDEQYPLYVVALTFTAKLKPNHVPCIQIKNNFSYSGVEYQTEITEPVTLACTSVDFALWQEHYDLDIISWDGGWYFRGTQGIFCNYIDKWSKIKAESTGGMRTIAKLHLNSLYGKFASNPNVTGKIPVLENGIVKLVLGKEETRDPVYTPMGVFITAYARDVTIRAAQRNYATFAYADTDSLHLITDSEPVGIRVHPNELGAWKHEFDFVSGLYVRPKCYSERMADGSYATHVAGLPETIAREVTFADFTNGHEWFGKLLPTRVPGGIVLTPTSYTLKF